MVKKNLFLITLFLLFGLALSFTSTIAQDELIFDSVYRIAWSPVENRIAFASFRNLYVWDFDIGKFILKQNLDESMPLSGLRWSPDGTRLAANSYAGKTLKVWDINTGKLTLAVMETTSSYGLDWTPDGKQILTASTGLDNVSATSRWDAMTGKLLALYDGGAVAIYRSPDSRTLATLSDLQIVLRDATTLEDKVRLNENANIDEGFLASYATWSSDGKLLAGGYRNGMVRIWDVASSQLINQFKANDQIYADVIKQSVLNGVVPSDIAALAFSPDSKSLWVLSYDGTLRQWDTNTGKFILEQQIGTPIFAADWSPDRAQLAVGIRPVMPVVAATSPEDHDLSLEELGLKVIVPMS